MSIQHKFYSTNFGTNFRTRNAILSVTSYKPELMIIGTFNPDTPHANFADFFYGRNYFWPAIKNLFIHNNIILTQRRMPQNGVPQEILDPSLHDILELCLKLKLTFSDLILEVLHNNETQFQVLPNDNIIFNEQEYNLIQDGKKGNIKGLQQLEELEQIHWNTNNIIEYLSNNPQIRSIYFTRRPTSIWASQWNQIANHESMIGRNLINIFTPSGQGAPVFHSMARLLHHWVHNTNPNFGKLNIEWLLRNRVNPNNF